MKTRLLFFALLMVAGILNAQDTIRSLVISEVRLDDARESYVEIANVGATTLNLSNFQIGVATPWNTPKVLGNLSRGWNVNANSSYRLPDKDLAPGQTFIIGGCYDWNPEAWAKDPTKGVRVMNKKEFWTISDIQAHFPESPTADPTDSVNIWYNLLNTWGGRECIFLAQYFFDVDDVITDSVVIDQVNGYEFDADGTRDEGPHDVAGVTGATGNTTLVRRFSVKTGNIDFLAGAGIDYTDSEWMPIPRQLGGWEQIRSLFFTAGNHGDYNLDETTLSSSTVDINWTDSVLTVPWGVRRDDSLMFQFDSKPGLAWHFDYSPSYEDSAYYSLRTGDIMTIYACGNDLDVIKFKIVVSPPTNDANIVVPKKMYDLTTGFYSITPPSWVITDKVPGMDTIMEIPFGIRKDTLLKYIEKAPEATWAFEWVDGNVRTDLKTGDILKVTAKSGAVKRYYIKPDKFQKSHNAYAASITWPDIPEFYKGLYGWVGDTIPNFVSSKYEYKVQVPYDVDGIPALVAKTQDVNAALEVIRAKNLSGSLADRTVTFTVTAQDDTSKLSYNIQLEKEKDYANIQPWIGEPFISQYVWRSDYANLFVEIYNPGTEPLDMSNYMITSGYPGNAAAAITQNSGTTNFANRYTKYIPGYKWQSQAEWEVQPAIAVQDINTDPIVMPGDVFVWGEIRSAPSAAGYPPAGVVANTNLDIVNNPWGETIADWSALQNWYGKIFLFKILNDSVKLGTKPANDPNDFEALDVFGDVAGQWTVGGILADQCHAWARKPEVFMGNPEIGGSFGTTEEDSEWIMTNEARLQAQGYGWPAWRYLVADGVGSHFMKDYNGYKSTVSSTSYKVSEGYTLDEQIRGVVTGTTVEELLANLVKADEGQSLYVIAGSDTLTSTDVVANGDILSVVSFDQQNTTSYVFEVTPEGLSSDAVLISTEYTIEVSGATGTVGGFDYGVTLRSVVENVTVPDGASFNVIDGADAYVPLMLLNYDTLLVDVQVSADIYFEVIAENGSTKIVYQLVPNMMNSGAFLTSNVFSVDQDASLIDLVPDGTAVYGLMKYLIPAPGATMMLVDKLGYERTIGYIYKDDRVVVTSEDGVTIKTYYLKVLSDETSYLAYVLSDVYTVDQLEFTITGWTISVNTSISTFLSNLTAAEAATVAVTNAAGDVQSGNLDFGDQVVVTAGDGVTKNTYAISVGNATDNMNSRSINVYPNPSSGMIYVSGLEAGNRVYVNNMMGQRMIDRVVQQNTEVIDLKGQAAGVYFVTVNNGDKVVGRYKLILQ